MTTQRTTTESSQWDATYGERVAAANAYRAARTTRMSFAAAAMSAAAAHEEIRRNKIIATDPTQRSAYIPPIVRLF